MARRSFSKVQLLGFIGNALELRSSNGGKNFVRFQVATTEVWGTGDDRKERTEWSSVVAFGKSAEILCEHTRKGSYILIDGRLRTESYQVQGEAKPRYQTNVVVDEFVFLDKPDNQNAPTEAPPAIDNSDDIPFEDAARS